MLGIWPSRAITFLENHDTGSTLQHWPFPWEHAAQGYAYLLTHCGTPCVFYDHMYYDVELREHITKLIAIRKRFRINNKSEVCVCGGGVAREVERRGGDDVGWEWVGQGGCRR